MPLTAAGKSYAGSILEDVYEAEQAAMEKTLRRFSPQFVDAMDYFADCICRELDHRPRNQTNRKEPPAPSRVGEKYENSAFRSFQL
ncbi:MAG: hypothetical protein ACLU9S_06820 [Oscillospiraceae bacterium]